MAGPVPVPRRSFSEKAWCAMWVGVPLAALAAGACFLPLGTAAPQSARTVGKGDVGVSLHGEAPTVDVIASSEDEAATDSDDYDYSPLPILSVEAAYGLTDTLDLELALDGILYVVLPLPLGGALGLRQQVVDREALALSIHARVGYVTLGAEGDSDSQLRAEHSAVYGKAGATAQLNPRGRLRPGLAVQLAPAHVRLEHHDRPDQELQARSASLTGTLTAVFGSVEVGPFANLVYFDSPRLFGSTFFMTGGLSIAYRPQKP